MSYQLSSGLTPWLDEYQGLIARVRNPKVSIKTLDMDGITRGDATMNRLKMDQANVVVGDDDQQNTLRYNEADLMGYP